MAPSVDQFRAFLTDVGIVSANELRLIEDSILPGSDATEEIATQLVERRKLTRFQADAICRGDAQSLVMGNYLILDKLGQGGMGVVYKARHRRMKREVALKILPNRLIASVDAVKRFQREVEAAAQLEHPNIVTAHDADESNGVHFLVMQFVDGTDLSNVVKQRGPLPLHEALNYVVQVAKGLEYAHAKGIIHRDIKPANLFLSRDGTIKILDMGLARLDQQQDFEQIAPAATQLTGTGVIMGTVDYMAPEQALDAKNADGRADIYSLGCTLYYLLTGKPVYSGDTLMKRLVAHREKSIPSLRQQRNDIPKQLDEIYQNMVAKNPADRYQSAAEVVTKLESIEVENAAPGDAENVAITILVAPEMGHFQDQLIATVEFPQVKEGEREDTALSQIDETARLPSIYESVSKSENIERTSASISHHLQRRQTRKTKVLIGGGIATGLLLVGILIVFGKSAFNDTRLPKSHSNMLAPPLDSTDGGTESMTSEANLDSADKVLKNAETVRWKFDGKATYVLVDSLQLDPTKPFTVEAIVTPMAHERSVLLTVGDFFSLEIVKDPVVARQPDGLVWGGMVRNQGAYNFESSEPLKLAEPIHLACVSDGAVISMYVNGNPKGGKGGNIPNSGSIDSSISGKAQSERFVIGGELTDGRLEMPFTGIVHEIRVSVGERYRSNFQNRVPHKLETDTDTIAMYDFASTDGKSLQDLSQRGNDGLIVNGLSEALSAPGPSVVVPVADSSEFPPDTPPEVVAVLGDWRFRDWRNINGLSFNHDGTRLAAGGDNGNVMIWEFLSGRLARRISARAVESLALSPDGNVLATDGFKLTLWRVANGDQLHEINHSGIGKHVAFSPNSQMVASTGKEDETDELIILIHDVETGKELHRLTSHTADVTGLLFHPGGKFLASASEDGTIRFWDAASGQQIGGVMEGITGRVGTISFSEDGSLLAFATAELNMIDGEVRLWDVDQERLRETRFKTKLVGNPPIQLSPNGQFLVTVDNSRIDLWDIENGEKLRSVYGIPGATDHVRFSPDGKIIAAAGSSGRIQLWDVETGNFLHEPSGHLSRPLGVAFSPDGKTIASVDGNSNLCIWDAAEQKLIQRTLLEGFQPYSVAFMPDGEQIVVGEWSGMELFNVKTAQSTLHRYFEKRVSCLALSSRGELAAFGGYKKPVVLIETSSGKRLYEFDTDLDSDTKAIAFSPNDELLAIPGPNSTITLWNVLTHENIATLEGTPGEVLCLVFSSTGKTLVAACYESLPFPKSEIASWDVSTGHLNSKFGNAASSLIEAISFRFDDKVLASTATDGTLRLWDTENWKCLRTIQIGPAPCMIPTVAFSPDGRYLVTANSNGTLTILDVADVEQEQQD